ncbi:MAG: phosphotransferase family protein [Thermoplasmatota archaeon]
MTEPLVHEHKLVAFLDSHLPLGGPRDFSIARHQAGHSNETFFITWGDRDLVLRRPPSGAFLPTAHDVLREYRVLTALATTNVRAPRPLVACEDESVIGAPFYLMEKVEGFVLRDRLPRELEGAATRARIGHELVDALTEIHAVDVRSPAVAALGKAEGYLERQLKRWAGQMELTLPWTQEKRPVPELVEVGARLAKSVPRSPKTTLVHGDYKLDNVVFGDDGRLRAVLDWEMSTLGDPLADVGWMLSFWREARDPADDLLTVTPRMTELPGFATRKELVARYEGATGTRVEHLDFYEALAVWKLAILLEGSYARHLAGATDDPFFAEMERAVPALARRALATLAGERPL